MDGAMAAQGMAVPGMAAPGTGAAMAVATAVLMGAVVTAAAMAVAMAVVMVAWEGTAGQDTAVDMGDPLDTEATAPAMGEVIADMGLSTEAPLEGQRWGALQVRLLQWLLQTSISCQFAQDASQDSVAPHRAHGQSYVQLCTGSPGVLQCQLLNQPLQPPHHHFGLRASATAE